MAEWPSSAPGGTPRAQRSRPVDVVPVRHRAEHAGRVDVAAVPVEDAAHAGEPLPHERGVVAMHVVVVHHRDVDQREGRDELRQLPTDSGSP